MGCMACLPYGFPFCCELFTGMPDHYKVTHSKVQKTVVRKPFGCACFGIELVNDNTDVSTLRDVDSIAATDCCAVPPGVVLLTKEDGSVERLQVKSTDCEVLSGIITSCMEESTMDKSQT